MKPDTIMGWYRRLVARKFDGSKSRRYPGRPRIDDETGQGEAGREVVAASLLAFPRHPSATAAQ